MNSRTKLGLITIIILVSLLVLSRTLGKTSRVYKFDFSKTLGLETVDSPLSRAVKAAIQNTDIEDNGTYAVYVEDLIGGDKYGFNESISFPAASLYKLIVMAAVLKEVEVGDLKINESISSNKTHLSGVLGSEDFGYENAPETVEYTVDEALTRVGSISDNFAAIMLTERLHRLRISRAEENKLLIEMAKELSMNNTSFTSKGGPTTTAIDVGTFFKHLYNGQVVSKIVSDKIIGYLSGSKINNRIPSKLPEDTKVVHKTGELARIRHDAGIVYLPNNPYVIVLLSKDLTYEDDGIESLAQISKGVFEYFNGKVVK